MNKNCIVKQNDMCDCGACCLLSIVRYYNGDIPLETIRLDTRTGIGGTTAYNIIKAAEKYGFSTSGIKVEDIGSREISFPAIVHLVYDNGLNHFAVIYKYKNNIVYLMDPAKGFVKMPINEFNNIWSKVIILFNPECKLPLIEKKTNIIKILSNIILNEKYYVIKIIISSILISFISLLISYYVQIVINYSNLYSSVYYVLFVFLLIYILKVYYSFIRNNYLIYINKNLDIDVLQGFLSHIFKLPLNIISSRTSGELITRIYELNNIKSLFSEVFVSVFLDFLFVICSSIFLYKINNVLFFILCIISFIYLLVGLIMEPIIKKKTNNNIDLETNCNGILSESIKCITTIKNLNIESYFKEKVMNNYYDFLDDSIKYQKFLNNYDLIKNIISELGIYIVSSLGLVFVLKERITLLDFITFNGLVSYFVDPIKNCINMIPRLDLIKISINKIEEFINIECNNNVKTMDFSNGDIEFRNVSYSYDDYNYLLNNINFKINKFDRVSINGVSGSGKSTICNIINGNIEEYNGEVLINGINIKNYTNNDIKSNVLYLSQCEKLFSDTIYNNICLDNKYNSDELNNALKLTFSDEILLKKRIGLNTFLIDGGFNLSGGERQRLILCRALLRKPSILILDESLSEVNESMEKDILKGIDNYLKETTIIYISHGRNTFSSVLNLG